jgi:hypothetical protein
MGLSVAITLNFITFFASERGEKLKSLMAHPRIETVVVVVCRTQKREEHP